MKNVFIFLAGAAVGSVVTWKVVEKRYRDLADEEIESVKETFRNRLVNDTEEEKETVVQKEENSEVVKNRERIEEIIKNNNYQVGVDTAEEGTESQQVEEIIEVEDDEEDYTVPVEVGNNSSVPYVISEEEYGEFGNEEKTLIYYSDYILTDEDDDVITDPESVIGNALKEFDKPTTVPIERVYVRDEANEIDYIILRSEKSYSEVYGEEEQ